MFKCVPADAAGKCKQLSVLRPSSIGYINGTGLVDRQISREAAGHASAIHEQHYSDIKDTTVFLPRDIMMADRYQGPGKPPRMLQRAHLSIPTDWAEAAFPAAFAAYSSLLMHATSSSASSTESNDHGTTSKSSDEGCEPSYGTTPARTTPHEQLDACAQPGIVDKDALDFVELTLHMAQVYYSDMAVLLQMYGQANARLWCTIPPAVAQVMRSQEFKTFSKPAQKCSKLTKQMVVA